LVILFVDTSLSAVKLTPDHSFPTSPGEDMSATFDPSRPSVSPEDSVLLLKSEVPRYLDVALKALTLHTEARTSFITYASLSPSILLSRESHWTKTFFSSYYCNPSFLQKPTTKKKNENGRETISNSPGAPPRTAHSDIGCRNY